MPDTSPATGFLSHNYIAIRPDWLERHREPILEPELPIVDPHHHLWDRPGWRYLLDDLLADTGSGHNIVATVYRAGALDAPRRRARTRCKPVGETEFVNGVAAMSASGAYGKIRVCAGIVGHADLTLGDRVEPVLEAHDARRRRPLPRHPPHHDVGCRRLDPQPGLPPAAGADGRPAIPRRLQRRSGGSASRSMRGSTIRRSTR